MTEPSEARPFPAPGETVTAEDGSTWVWQTAHEPATDGSTYVGHWEQAAPAGDDQEALQEQEGAHLAALSNAHRVYALTFGACRVVKREDTLTEFEPPEAYVHALAHSALIDAILAVVTPPALGTLAPHAVEDATLTRLRALLGDPELATARGKLDALRQQISAEETPDSVVVKAREHRSALGEIAISLPMGCDARNTIEGMMSARQPPQPGIADKLFRELIAQNAPVETAWRAHSAASAFAAAFA